MEHALTASAAGAPERRPLLTRAGDVMRLADALRLSLEIAETAIAAADAAGATNTAARLRSTLEALRRSF